MKQHKVKLFFLIMIVSYEAFSQLGCTDPQALNYNSGAIINDGSCLYDVSDYTPVLLGDLPSLLNETSGLIYWNEKLVTFNDSGGANKIGPALYNVVGRKVGSVADYKYSKALASYDKDWTFEELNGFLKKPASYIKGTKMSYAGLRKEKDRASIIKYLNQNSDSPKPLP